MKLILLQFITWNELFEILVIALLLLILFVAKFYLPSYFKEKGKNYAKSQDIENLTEMVKNIEHKYDLQAQSIKAKLDLSNQISIGIHNEDRNYLIEFHKTMYEYHTLLVDYTFGGMSFENNEEIGKYFTLRSFLYNKLLASKATSYLFIQGKNFLEIKIVVAQIFVDFARLAKEMIDFLILVQNENSNIKPNQSLDEIKKQYASRREVFNKYNKLVSDYENNTSPKLDKFSDLIKEYISQMPVKE